ncbi:peptide/nickel transport system ATP-binding protein [Paenibacillus sp. ov031]|uniref:oligopeptide/dipeptide ABC transporter ATP-binding protein n=1 Tax=Paenibacillus sp. ov031 TaxID=1761879 RepID=UPI00091DFEDB|nr:ABC transporter ATP-binding protein [Paenibacillus sp. ov031]SHN81208.1 peptide/nickel transport system ATP-binding protein [Paenibacillus sp. ov031]
MALLEVEEVSVSFRRARGWFGHEETQVIQDLNLSVNEGEIVAVVGASGSGKSVLAQAIMGILPANATIEGRISYAGEPLTMDRQLHLRGDELVYIPQSVSYLDPLLKVGRQVQPVSQKTGRKHGSTLRSTMQKAEQELTGRYGLPQGTSGKYPFELSGGMARRVLMATATSGAPKLIIADEPTPGIHPEVLAETMKHFRQLANEGVGILWITHDITTALTAADRISVFYAGSNVETAQVCDFTGKGERLRHPYTKALWNALPQNDFQHLSGTQPAAGRQQVEGCSFAPRCIGATMDCTNERPELRKVRGGEVRCIHAT